MPENIEEKMNIYSRNLEIYKNEYQNYMKKPIQLQYINLDESILLKVPLLLSLPKTVHGTQLYDILYNFFLQLISPTKKKPVVNPRKKNWKSSCHYQTTFKKFYNQIHG